MIDGITPAFILIKILKLTINQIKGCYYEKKIFEYKTATFLFLKL